MCDFCRWEDGIEWEKPLADMFFEDLVKYNNWLEGNE